MSGGERLIADARAFAAGMEEERQQILAMLKHRRELLQRLGAAGSRGLVEVRHLIHLLEERSRMGS